MNGTSTYSEKLNVGYRWYDATGHQPLFPFGFGLSYTTFRLSHLVITPTKLGRSQGLIHGTVDVTNTGHRAGAEVVEAYVSQPAANGEPPRQLCAFAKVFLKPGETRQVRLTIAPRALSYYDTGAHRWTTAAGDYRILVGTSSRDLPLQSTVSITDRAN